MGVVTISSSASRTAVQFSANISMSRSASRRTLIIAFKADKCSSKPLLTHHEHEQTHTPVEASKKNKLKLGKGKKSSRKAVLIDELPAYTLEVDYNDAAAKLESLYKLTSTITESEVEDATGGKKKGRPRRKRATGDEQEENGTGQVVFRNKTMKPKRLTLNTRISLKKNGDEDKKKLSQKKKDLKHDDEKIEKLVREYSASSDLVSLDWKKMKIPPVLPSTEHHWLFKLMQPMKAIFEVKENLKLELDREPTENELADAASLTILHLRKRLEVARAARSKLIKHNLRLVMFVINKYFQDFANGPRFQDLCQAGVKGLITAIDRFEPNRKLKLSTYSVFWIRHAISRSMTVSSFTRVSFGLESVRVEIQRAKLELIFELQRLPTEDEIIEKVRISPERYHEVMRASKPIYSLYSRHSVTQEEFISAITDVDGGDNTRQPAILRLALDDVLDSLKPKESLVIRQRYGLDGKGDRTLAEIAGNLNISREMVRKHEVKALMKLKHPARVDYLRQYII